MATNTPGASHEESARLALTRRPEWAEATLDAHRQRLLGLIAGRRTNPDNTGERAVEAGTIELYARNTGRLDVAGGDATIESNRAAVTVRGNGRAIIAQNAGTVDCFEGNVRIDGLGLSVTVWEIASITIGGVTVTIGIDKKPAARQGVEQVPLERYPARIGIGGEWRIETRGGQTLAVGILADGTQVEMRPGHVMVRALDTRSAPQRAI